MLKETFSPDVVPVTRPLVKNKKIYDYWLVGFTSAEGCFIIKVLENKNFKTGFQAQLKFIISQHARDE